MWRCKKGMCKMCRSIANLKIRGQRQSVVNRKFTHISPCEEGQALVEAALVLPMLLTIGTGILIFGIFMMQVLSLTEGVGNAGRVLAVSGGVTLDPCAAAVTAVQNSAPLLNTSNLTYQITLNPGTGDVVYNGSSCSSSSTTTGAAGNLVSGGTAKVKVSYSNCSLSFYGNNLMPGGCSISQSVMETVQ
jgi:Flp pilus assembly protein TadG